MTRSEVLLGLPDFQITGIQRREGKLRISARYRNHCYMTREGWLFANPATGKEEIQKKPIRAAAKAAGIKTQVGWKTFRHSYRSWLDQTEAPIGVQRELMRHVSIQTTMNVYGRAMTDSKRQAHNNVVQMILKVGPQKTTTALTAENPEPVANVVQDGL